MKTTKTTLRRIGWVLGAPIRLVRSLRYDPSPYGGDNRPQRSGEDTARHASINNLGHWS